MQIYNYDPLTLEFLFSGLADPDPLDAGNWLIPADATTIEPLPKIQNKVSCFNKDTESWEYKADYRGEVWYMLNGDKLTIERIDQLPEDSWTKEPPPPTPEQLSLTAKREKEKALATITVTTSSGKVFDGNETARSNMLSAITAANFIGQTTANWKLADNTIALVTLDEVHEALALSIQRVGEIVTA